MTVIGVSGDRTSVCRWKRRALRAGWLRGTSCDGQSQDQPGKPHVCNKADCRQPGKINNLARSESMRPKSSFVVGAGVVLSQRCFTSARAARLLYLWNVYLIWSAHEPIKESNVHWAVRVFSAIMCRSTYKRLEFKS